LVPGGTRGSIEGLSTDFSQPFVPIAPIAQRPR
jgi:hypothetical protein